MQSIFRYPGGKSKAAIRNWILSQIPSDTLEYREPFVGGGGVFFGINPKLKRWINDRHPQLISVYRALQQNNGFITECKKIKASKQVFTAFKSDKSALSYLFLNRTSFWGRVNYDMPTRVFFSNPQGWNISRTQRLEEAALHLHNVKITCGDYERLLKEPGPKVWLYLDPPYVANTRMTDGNKLYQHNFTEEDHVRLARLVKQCQHQVCISYDDYPEIRSLYRGFRVVKRNQTYCGSNLTTKPKKTELLILNY
jgi:DNA adenine methylase